MFALLLLFSLTYAYSIDALNEFSADVDYYDMGVMARGKNAGSWHRSLKAKQEVFYYLAMQPWRHLVWTDCTGAECFKYYINEDASNVPSLTGTNKLGNKPTDTNQDYCRKEYAHPMATFDFDWSKIKVGDRLESEDINGQTCYKYPAKLPLAYIYLQQHYTSKYEVKSITPCRFDFIGGRSITFRSKNEFSDVFITNKWPNGYLDNKTRCRIDPSPNNVDTDLAIVLGISDVNAIKPINEAIASLKALTTVKSKKVYYMFGDSVQSEEFSDWTSLSSKQVSVGSVDSVIKVAKNDLVKRITSKSIYRGTMIVLMDTALSSSFNAETEFDRNNITVHTIVYNPKDDKQLVERAKSLLSLGEHYHEYTKPGDSATIGKELFVGVRVNLTERCNRTSCNGFCDGRDRCTCPMCCENTCFFTFCDAKTATCKEWPEAKPKEKITCKNDCVGNQTCFDLQGCVYTNYNKGCEPSAKCMKPYCEGDTCLEKSTCETDKTPSYQNRCWRYDCNKQNGLCERVGNGGKECPKLKDLCYEYVCDENTLDCLQVKKECVKTAPYIEMSCYEAKCNKATGNCENKVTCGSYMGCGTTINSEACTCSSDGTCKCGNTKGFCTGDQICDSSGEGEPVCKTSVCGENLYREGCRIKKCNDQTKEIYWEDLDCSSKVVFKPVATASGSIEDAKKYCEDKYEKYCEDGVCYGRMKRDASSLGGCGICTFNEAYTESKGIKTYTYKYEENCGDLKPKCANGLQPNGYEQYFKNGEYAECKATTTSSGEEVYKCVYNKPTNEYDLCAECYSSLECYKDEQYRDYEFDTESGQCKLVVLNTKVPECTECENNKYVEKCKDVKFEKTYKYTYGANSKEFKYHIPKDCTNDQCIPVREFDCQTDNVNVNPEIAAIVNALKACSAEGAVDGIYHYSELWDEEVFMVGNEQTAEFMKTAEQEAYCIWTVKEKNCQYCGFDTTGKEMIKHDKCQEEEDKITSGEPALEGLISLSCVPETNTCKIDEYECEPQECFYYKPSGSEGCVKTEVSTCDSIDKDIEDRKAYYETLGLEEEEVVCNANSKCNPYSNTCSLEVDSEACAEALRKYKEDNHDYGCKIPNVECNEDTLHCTFKELTNPEDDTRYFRERDNVVLGNKCYQYTCVETTDGNGHYVHHWVQTEESKYNLTRKAESICDEAFCDPETGYFVSQLKKCDVSIHFKQIDVDRAECFYCQCSYKTGEMVLTMYPDTDTRKYSLDACGNCIVRDNEGNQVNKKQKCDLEVPPNLTGAIAGATVAASVVFALIGAMVVVSIGAFQTYQLVTSALKNVVNTTLENPEFVAADNTAANVHYVE